MKQTERRTDRQKERKKVRNESKGDRGLSLRIGQCHGLRERKKKEKERKEG